MTTVSVTPVDGHRALLMHWTKHPHEQDIRGAYQAMINLLSAADAPLWIVVDVSAHPHFPLSETISWAYWGPFRNPKLAEWLVVGPSMTAQTIGRALIRLSGRDNIRWFDTMDAALRYLSTVQSGEGAPL